MSAQAENWIKYKEFVSDIVQSKLSYYCRGQSNDNKWPLQTSFHRVAVQAKITLTEYRSYVLPELRYHVSAVQNELIDLENSNELLAFLALVQHHGFPTPLLDWTLSPYIAAYFAYREVDEKMPKSEIVRVFFFDYVEWSKTYKQPFGLDDNSEPFVSILRPNAKHNPRVIPQQGVFTITNVFDMEAHILAASERSKKDFVTIWALPVKEKPLVMRELSLMGITEMTMFPSIEGICRAFKAHFFSLDKIGPTPEERMDQLIAIASKYKQAVPPPNPS